MATDFIIPKLGEGVDKVTIVQWLVNDGDKVAVGDEILEVETDKASMPIEANAAGHIRLGPFKAGDEVSVDQVVATFGSHDEAFAPGSGGAAPSDAPATQTAPTSGNGTQTTPDGLKVTPVAQKVAESMGVDLTSVSGSGILGKITKADVVQAASGEAPKPPAQTQPAEVPKPTPQPEKPKPEPKAQPDAPKPAAPSAPADDVLARVPLKGVRGVIARRMAESTQTTARVTLASEVDVTEFVALRTQLKATYAADWGFAPGYNELLAMLAVSALQEFPYMNARMSADGTVIEHLKPINIGLAVDTDRGLLVVVLKDAAKKGLHELGSEFRALVKQARAGKSNPDDLTGGTFTISNLGMYRVDAFTPVINLPEAAILGVGRIVKKPVVKDDEVVIREMMTLSLVFDHRLVDGAPAARFLDYLCDMVEDPALFLFQRR